MRVCPVCFSLFGPDQAVCPKDGTATESHIQVLIGKQLGPYVVRAFIGEGGMGVVYAGEHPTLGKRVALKVLRPELSLREDIVERFIQEARAISTIGHSNIVNIYDFGRTPFGSFYLVMEYLDGRTIRAILTTGGPQPIERVRMVLMGIGAALTAAHAKGFIHRDIKPENIMVVNRAGQEIVKLLDFGIVKLLTRDPAHQSFTGSGMGTPQYMSPEQLVDAPIDHRADIFSLGAVTYEMLTGQVPFPGKTPAEVRQIQLTRTPSPPSVFRTESHLSRSLDKAILWALNLDPTSRCKSIEEFLSAFQTGYENTLAEQYSIAHQANKLSLRSRFRRSLFIISGILIMVGFATVFYFHKVNAFKNISEKSSRYQAQGHDSNRPASDISHHSATTTNVDDKVREKILSALQSKDPQQRSLVIEFITQIGRPVLLQELRNALNDVDPKVVQKAALALGELKDYRATPALRKLLSQSVGFRALDIAMALAQLGDNTGLFRLKHELASARTEIHKMYALHALGKLRDPSAIAWKTLLKSNRMIDPQLKTKVLGYLTSLGDKEARRDLEVKMQEGNWTSRIEAAQAMSATDMDMAHKVLITALNAADEVEKLKAAIQLAQLKDDSGLKILEESLSSENSLMGQKCALALGRIPLPKVEKALQTALMNSSSFPVALAAAVALLKP